jgi:predicted amino acid racemase
MNPSACLHIDQQQLSENARLLQALCERQGVALIAVVKAGCGLEGIARAVLAGGCGMLADSRLDNIERLQQAGVVAPLMLLRLPSPSHADAVVRLADLSLNSEYDAIEALHRAALRQGRVHRIMLMVELGDRREGVLPAQLPALVERLRPLGGVRVVGIGSNFGCLGGVRTTVTNLSELVRCAREVEARLGYRLDHVSGGNSGALPLLLQGRLPAGINQLRVGFAMLLGRNPYTDQPLPGLHTGVFELEAELIEIQTKPSLPEGEVVLDAFGQVPHFEDRGPRIRGIVGLGRLDTDLATLRPADPRIEVIGASSDHLILDLTRSGPHRIGERIRFVPGYGALVQAMLSPYVCKQFRQPALTGPTSPARSPLPVSPARPLCPDRG